MISEEEKFEDDIYKQKIEGLHLTNAMTLCFHPLYLAENFFHKSSVSVQEQHGLFLQLPSILTYFERACYLKEIN